MLGRALNRFEAGLERNVVVEALNDHLLALRFLLEGGGPADLGLSMRVAALCAEPERPRRGQGRRRPRDRPRARALERRARTGQPPRPHRRRPLRALEDLARAILKDGAAGHLGSDLRVTADEILLADGLAAGDGAAEQRGGTTEWDLTPIEPDEVELSTELERMLPEPGASRMSRTRRSRLPRRRSIRRPDLRPVRVAGIGARRANLIRTEPDEVEDEMVIDESTRDLWSGRGPRGRRGRAGAPLRAADHLARAGPEPAAASEPAAEDVEFERARLIDDRGTPRPASPVLRLIEQTRAEREARTERVAGLFPAPETTEWNVRDITYDRVAPRPASPPQHRLPPITPGRAGRVTGRTLGDLAFPGFGELRRAAGDRLARSPAPEANR